MNIEDNQNLIDRLKESEERLKLVLWGADLGTWDWNIETGEVVFNERWAEMLGYTLAEIQPFVDSWEKLVHPDDKPDILSRLNAHLEGKTDFYESEHRLRHKSGHWVWVLDKGKVIQRSPDGKPLRACGTHLDITQRKNAELALKQREQYLHSILQTTGDGFFVLNSFGSVIEVNDAYCRLLGYSREELLGKHISDLDADETPEQSALHIQRVLENGSDVFETHHYHKTGRICPVEISTSCLDLDGGQYICFCRDISQRKAYELVLKQHSHLLENSPNAIYVSNQQGKIIFANKAASHQTGYQPQTLVGLSVWDIDSDVSESDYQTIFTNLLPGKPVQIRTRHRRLDGSLFPVELSLSKLVHEGTTLLCGIARDMTEQDARESALQRTQFTVDNSPLSIFWISPEGRFIYVNKKACQSLGYSFEELMTLGVEDVDVMSSEEIHRSRSKLFEQGGVVTFESFHKRRDGTTFSVLVHSYKVDFMGEAMEVAEVEDITERKAAEEALSQSRSILRQVLNTIPQSVFWKDVDGHYLGCNDAFATAIGFDDPSQIVGKTDFDLPWPHAEAVAYRADDREVIENNRPKYQIIEPLQQADGSRIWIDTTKIPMLGHDNKPFAVLGIYEDITERRKNEEALRQSEANLDAMINATPESAFLIDTQGIVISCNRVAAQRLGLQPQDLLGHSIFDFIPPDVAAFRQKFVKEVIQTGQPVQFEDVRTGRYFSHYLYPVFDSQGLVIRIAIFGHDITEYRQAESNLKKQTDLLIAIGQAQDLFISGHDPHQVYQNLLHILVQATGSAYGFLDEVLYEPDGTPYKLSLALSDISWDENSRTLYQQLVERKLEFRNLNNLAGAPVLERRTIIANNVSEDPHYHGTPHGYPLLETYLGIPLYYGDEIIGEAGIANRPGGYNEEIIAFISPLLKTCAAMIWADRMMQRDRSNVEALRKSEENYRILIDTSNEGIWSMDANHVTTYVNQAMATMLGYDIPEILGKKVEDFLFPEDMAFHQERMKRRHAGEDEVYERRFKRKDGTPLWTLVSAKVLKDEQGNFAGSFAMFTDITERKKAEDALRASERKWRNILLNTPQIGIALNPQAQIIFVNKHFLKLTGWQEEEVLGQNWFDLFIPEDVREEVRIVFDTSMHSREVLGYSTHENEILTRSGERRNIAWSNVVTRDIHGNITDVTCLGVDLTERNLAEEALRQNEERYRTVADFTYDWEYWQDPEGQFIYCSPACKRITGYSSDDFIKDPELYLSIIHPEDRNLFMQHLQEIVHESFIQVEFRIITLCGEIRWIGHVCQAVHAEDGRYLGRRASNRDITDRKLADQALRESEARFRSIISVSNTGAWEYHRSTDYLWCSPEYFTMLGYNPEAFKMDGRANLKETWIDLLHPDDREPARQHFADYLKNGSVGMYENYFRLRHFDGSWVWIWSRGQTLRNPDGSLTDLTLGTHININEQKLADQALRESEARFRLFAELAPVGIVISEYNNQISEYNEKTLYISQTFIDIFGYTLEDIPTVNEWWSLAYPDEQMRAQIRQEWEALVRESRKTGKSIDPVEYPVRCKDGKTRQIEFRLACTDKLNFVMFTDVTERRHAEEEHKRLTEELNQAQKMESVGRLAGGVAHDFNNMLGVILGHTELALDQVDSHQPLYADLQEIRKAAERSANLTRQLLAFARKQTVMPKVLDLNETIEGTLKMLRRMIGEDIELAWLPASDLWAVKIDPSQIDQILANLCVNARDAISGVGKVTIQTSNAVFDADFCAHNPGYIPGEYVLLSVADNGCGMDKETQEKIFEPFFTTKETGKGTGLGLATVYGIIQQNNGFINLYSEPGHGSIFKLYLPRHIGKGNGAPSQDTAQSLPQGGETILLVEDEIGLLRMARKSLVNLGYHVLTANSPQEAIRLAESLPDRIDLLMTDVIMPEMKGPDLAKKLLPKYPKMKCLFMSGYTADVIAQEGVIEKGIHFLQKPFSLKNLAAKVREALESSTPKL